MEETQIKRYMEVQGFVQNFNSSLCHLLDEISVDFKEPIDLIFPKNVRKFMNMIAQPKQLKIRSVSLLNLTKEISQAYNDTTDSKLVFLIKPLLQDIKKVKNFLKSLNKNGIKKHAYVVFFPKLTFVAMTFIKQLKLQRILKDSLKELDLGLAPIDQDLLVIPLNSSTKQIFKENSFQPVRTCAEVLTKLQMIYGKASCFWAIGDQSQDALKIFEDENSHFFKKTEEEMEEDKKQGKIIDGIFIFDRRVDTLTPLLQQVSYQGQLDEHYGVEFKRSEIPKEVFSILHDEMNLGGKKEEKITFKMSSDNDPVYNRIKDLSLSDGREIISKYRQRYKAMIEEVKVIEKGRKVKLLNQIAKENTFSLRYQQHLLLSIHLQEHFKVPQNLDLLRFEQNCVGGGSTIKDLIPIVNNMIATNQKPYQILRIMAIYSKCFAGIPQKDFEKLTEKIVVSYGLKYLQIIKLLEQERFIIQQTKASTYYQLRKKPFELFDPKYLEKINEEKEAQGEYREYTSAPYMAYSPFISQLITKILDGTWINPEIYKALKSNIRFVGNPKDLLDSVKKDIQRSHFESQKTVVVYAIGGLTYGEIAALREVSKEFDFELLMVVSEILTPERFINGFI